jgi:hypothetical protein
LDYLTYYNGRGRRGNKIYNILNLNIILAYYTIMGGTEGGTKYLLTVGSMAKYIFVNGL